MRTWKGSYTVEAAVVVPILIWTMATGIGIGIDLLKEVRSQQEGQQVEQMWEVERFYTYQALKGVTE